MLRIHIPWVKKKNSWTYLCIILQLITQNTTCFMILSLIVDVFIAEVSGCERAFNMKKCTLWLTVTQKLRNIFFVLLFVTYFTWSIKCLFVAEVPRGEWAVVCQPARTEVEGGGHQQVLWGPPDLHRLLWLPQTLPCGRALEQTVGWMF